MPHDIMNMFATPLYKAALARPYSEAELECVRHSLQDPIFAISNHASRNKHVLDLPAMQGLREAIQLHLDQYFKTVFNTRNQVSLQITQSWLTLSRKGDIHHTHTHPNSVASGVLYISLAQNDGISFFRNDDTVWHDLLPAEENYFNSRQYFINARVGDLLIFPSNVRHGVREVRDDIERVSLSFNSFFVGELGREEFSTALKISLG